MHRPPLERKRALAKLFGGLPQKRVVEHFIGEGEALYRAPRQLKPEGGRGSSAAVPAEFKHEVKRFARIVEQERLIS